MKYTQSELDLAKKYLEGQYTDVQLNYWIVQNNFDKQKIENIIDFLRTTQPFLLACKLMIGFILFNYIVQLCFFIKTFFGNN